MEKLSSRERFLPLKKLAELWLFDFMQNEDIYLKTLIPTIISGDFSNFTKKESDLLNEIKTNFKKSEWKNFKTLFLNAIKSLQKETYNKETIKQAENYILNDDFLMFEKLYSENKNLLSDIQKKYTQNLENYVKKLRTNIINLSVKDFKAASSFFYKEAKKLPDKEKEMLGLYLEDVQDLTALLAEFRFMEADSFFYTKKIIRKEEYEHLKKEYVLRYFNFGNIDEEKAFAISSLSSNVLLRARAGSGKTSTICLKTLFLIEKYNANPDEILILAFNKEAKVKIRKDLGEKYGLNNYLSYKNTTGFENAKTFHSFAKSLTDENNKKIADDKKRKVLINSAIEAILNADKNKDVFYDFYKSSLNVPQKNEVNLSDDSSVRFVKDLSQVTLRGEIVKSHGEKYIADFLFENGIDYEYERSIIFSKEEKEALNIDDAWNVYRPDFYINYDGKEFYLEHWGVDRNALEPGSNKNKVIGDVSKYVKNMHIKRRYFRRKNIPLIETWTADSQIRENFEITLSKTLEKYGIRLVKQSREELFNKVKELNINSFYKTIGGFISTIKKSKSDIFSIERKINSLLSGSISDRTKKFLELGYKVYSEYQRLLSEENLIDFDDLIINATEKIMQTRGECEFRIFQNEKMKVKNLKYILIDEYQDFSKLFFDLILAIKCFNPKVQIFATGDDWQAINGFAGSNLYYFRNFKRLFNNSEVYNLTSNYRSCIKIIETSNTLMALDGIPSMPTKSESGEICRINVDKTFINKESTSDLIYSFKKDSGKIKAKYLKTVHRLIRLNPDKTFLILSRLNKISGSNLESEFSYKLFRMKTIDKNRVKVMTIHKSKGLEADIVIILRAINGVIPFIHPDYEIAAALDKSYDEILDEEKRLFYVALTRAKEKVYILTETKLESVYLKELNLNEIHFRDLNFENQTVSIES